MSMFFSFCQLLQDVSEMILKLSSFSQESIIFMVFLRENTFSMLYMKYNQSLSIIKQCLMVQSLKGVFAKNERGYRLNAIKKRF